MIDGLEKLDALSWISNRFRRRMMVRNKQHNEANEIMMIIAF
jgi:hypothetical protein